MSVMFWVWLAVIVLTLVVEILTMEIASIWFTFGATIPFILAAFDATGWEVQVIIFVIVSAVLLASLRGVTKKYLTRGGIRTNVSSLIGKQCRMLERTDFETLGSVKIGDVVWSAVEENRLAIEKDEIVKIVSVVGNKLVVKRITENETVGEAKNKVQAQQKSEKVKKAEEISEQNSEENFEENSEKNSVKKTEEITEQKSEEKEQEKTQKNSSKNQKTQKIGEKTVKKRKKS